MIRYTGNKTEEELLSEVQGGGVGVDKVQSMVDLGNYYSNEDAIKYWKMAIKQNNVDAMLSLGLYYSYSINDYNYYEADKYLVMAYNLGDKDAEHELLELYGVDYNDSGELDTPSTFKYFDMCSKVFPNNKDELFKTYIGYVKQQCGETEYATRLINKVKNIIFK